MIHFLRRSRIHHAITVSTMVYMNHVTDFWDNAEVNTELDHTRMISTVLGRQIIVTEETIRNVLQFGADGDARMVFPMQLIAGCFQRMGYPGVPPDQYRKAKLRCVWRYLMHIMIVCLSGRKGGLNGIGHQLGSAMIALVLNKPYNLSGYIFQNMVSNIQGCNKYYMFPRFV